MYNKKISLLRNLKSIWLITMVVVISAFILGSWQNVLAAGNNKELSILTWEGYVPEEIKKDFEKETGIKLLVTYFSDVGEAISRLRATGGEGYDLVQPTHNKIMDAQKAFKIFQPLDFSKILIMDNLLPSLVEGTKTAATIDGKQYAIPFNWGTIGIMVNTKKINKDVYSYMDLYDDKYKGRVTTRYTWHTFATAALGHGLDYYGNNSNKEIYRKMMEEMLIFLSSKKKNIKTYWTTRQENIDLMLSEECWIAQGWDGTAFFLNEKNPDIKFYLPKEGGLGWIDTYAISAGAENIEAAYKFINFMLTKKRGAQIIDKTGFLSAVKGAVNLIPAERQQLINDAYPPEAIDNIQWYIPVKSYVNEINAEMEEMLKVAR